MSRPAALAALVALLTLGGCGAGTRSLPPWSRAGRSPSRLW